MIWHFNGAKDEQGLVRAPSAEPPQGFSLHVEAENAGEARQKVDALIEEKRAELSGWLSKHRASAELADYMGVPLPPPE